MIQTVHTVLYYAVCEALKKQIRGFYVLFTVHLVIILINSQLDAQFFSRMFISILYMFRAAMRPSPGELFVSIRHLVYVTLYR
jgi:hypothetical protein